MVRTPVYLDHHATTPVDPRVLEAMLPYFTEVFGNPASSSHAFGWKAQEAVEKARREVAALIGATAREVVFTSGATESNNLALFGAAGRAAAGRRRVVVTAIEHKAVLEPAGVLESRGWRLTVLPVQPDGRVRLEDAAAAIEPDTALVSVMAANNEIGVTQPLAEIGAIARARGALFHVDAAQAAGKIPLDVERMQIDLLSLTAHKFYGPKGCGALYVRKRVDLSPIVSGGGQERRVRAGTLNVPGIVGLGAACAICRAELAAEAARTRRLRDRLLEGLQAGLDGVIVNGSLEHRLPNNLHVTFTGVDGESLLVAIGDVAVSSGSACGSASATPSHVLAAIGATRPDSAVVRFGIGRHTTDEEIDYAVEKFTTVVRHLRRTAPAQAG
jgi:cysteine desulfurase